MENPRKECTIFGGGSPHFGNPHLYKSHSIQSAIETPKDLITTGQICGNVDILDGEHP